MFAQHRHGELVVIRAVAVTGLSQPAFDRNPALVYALTAPAFTSDTVSAIRLSKALETVGDD
jgi:hypothetical protein